MPARETPPQTERNGIDILPSMNEGDSLMAINALIAEH
jgi:hypothetical protein